MSISDWSSDVCSSDLGQFPAQPSRAPKIHTASTPHGQSARQWPAPSTSSPNYACQAPSIYSPFSPNPPTTPVVSAPIPFSPPPPPLISSLLLLWIEFFLPFSSRFFPFFS